MTATGTAARTGLLASAFRDAFRHHPSGVAVVTATLQRLTAAYGTTTAGDAPAGALHDIGGQLTPGEALGVQGDVLYEVAVG